MLNKRHPALIVLKNLLTGGRYKQDGYTWCLDEDYNMCHVFTNQKGEEVLMKCSVTLGMFVRLCEKLPEEEIVSMVASTVLSGLDKKERE